MHTCTVETSESTDEKFYKSCVHMHTHTCTDIHNKYVRTYAPTHLHTHKHKQFALYLSASSKMLILCRPFGKVTFWLANILIWFLTTSIPLSLDALSSRTASLNEAPRSALARHRILVVFPVPGILYRSYIIYITIIHVYLYKQ